MEWLNKVCLLINALINEGNLDNYCDSEVEVRDRHFNVIFCGKFNKVMKKNVDVLLHL